MDNQTAFNLVLSLVAFLGGWVRNSLRDDIASLGRFDSIFADKVQHIEVLVAGSYIKHDDLDKTTTVLLYTDDSATSITLS